MPIKIINAVLEKDLKLLNPPSALAEFLDDVEFWSEELEETNYYDISALREERKWFRDTKEENEDPEFRKKVLKDFKELFKIIRENKIQIILIK